MRTWTWTVVGDLGAALGLFDEPTPGVACGALARESALRRTNPVAVSVHEAPADPSAVRYEYTPRTSHPLRFRGFPSAPERTRTSTDHSVHKALNLARLPIPPQAPGRASIAPGQGAEASDAW